MGRNKISTICLVLIATIFILGGCENEGTEGKATSSSVKNVAAAADSQSSSSSSPGEKLTDSGTAKTSSSGQRNNESLTNSTRTDLIGKWVAVNCYPLDEELPTSYNFLMQKSALAGTRIFLYNDGRAAKWQLKGQGPDALGLGSWFSKEDVVFLDLSSGGLELKIRNVYPDFFIADIKMNFLTGGKEDSQVVKEIPWAFSRIDVSSTNIVDLMTR